MSNHRCKSVDRRSLMRGAAAVGLGISGLPILAGLSELRAAWPMDRAVRIVVSGSPGGPSDIAARLIAQALQAETGGSYVVENRPGGGANLGMQAVIRAEPDGYTLHVATSVWVINPSLYSPSPHDPYKDLVPVCEIASSPTVFVVTAASGIKSMAEAAAIARKDQSKFNIATPPLGTTLHLGAEMFKSREKLSDVAISVYAGGGQAIQALLSGIVQLCSSSLAPALPHIESGALRAIAVLGETRLPELPGVPTATEVGYQGFNFDTYVALMAPAKTPSDITAKLEAATIAVLKQPDLQQKFQRAGFQVQMKTGNQHMDRIVKEVPMFREIISTAGIKL